MEKEGIEGLKLKAGRGRKPKLKTDDPQHVAIVKTLIENENQNLTKVRGQVRDQLGIELSKKTLQRFLKNLNTDGKRFRKRLKGKDDPDTYQAKKELLEQLMKLEDQQAIQLYFTDETGFSLTPSIPYGWIPVAEQWTIRSAKDRVCNLFGLLSRKGDLRVYSTAQNINSNFIIECVDEIADQIQMPTVLVMDNAPWHKSELIKARQTEWNEKGLYLFYLPTYSPHLNLIETLWRKIKYEWLRPEDYLSTKKLKDALFNIITKYDNEFSVNISKNFFCLG